MARDLVCPGCGATDGIRKIAGSEYECTWCHRKLIVETGHAAEAAPSPVAGQEVKLVVKDNRCALCGKVDNLRACASCGKLFCGFHRSRIGGQDICDNCRPSPSSPAAQGGGKGKAVVAVVVAVVVILALLWLLSQ